MTVQDLKNKFYYYKENDVLLDHIFELKKDLLSSDSIELLEFHYTIMKDNSIKPSIRNMIMQFFYSDIENKRDKKNVSEFLFEKYNNEHDINLKSDILRILGHLRSPIAKLIAVKELNSVSEQIRYNSIIVIGWTGVNEDIPLLNERLLNDPIGKLRGYAATSMRQIWFNFPDTKDIITDYIYNSALTENDSDALVGMIITIQDLYKKKFGIKESRYGDVSGDVISAKEKMMIFLDKMIRK